MKTRHGEGWALPKRFGTAGHAPVGPMAFTVFDPATSPLTNLVQALLAPNSGISLIASSINLRLSRAGAVNLYDSAVGTPLGIGAGVLLTSGITPGTSNTSTWYGADNSGSSGFSNGDADIDAVVNTVFQTQSYDATTLKFDFNVSDPLATSISFDLVFGSDEYPEWVDAFVDCGVVIVDGVNYALFNNDPLHPLSVISPNLAAGYFQDNSGNTLPIEYDGVSGRLRIVAPLKAGLSSHTIKIGIADTGDHILDSGLFIANLSAGTTPGSGVVSNPGGGTSGDDNCSGTSKDEYFDLQAGNDTVYAGAGADIIVAGSGNDKVYAGSGNDDLKGDGGDDWLDGGADLDTAVFAGLSTAYQLSYDALSGSYSINGSSKGEGIDTLIGIEQLQFADGLFALANDGTTAVLTAVGPPPPPPVNTAGMVLLSGLAAVGATLTASLVDADGVPSSPASISWQWISDNVPIAGATTSSYLVQASDSNHSLWVEATYSDAKGNSETPLSASVFVQPLNTDGELTATPMVIEGPASASVNTSITTLLLRAVELGETPNSAIQKIRSALKVPSAVSSLLSTNAFKILQTGVGDTATALALAKLEVQVDVLCSVSDDSSGLKLTLALLNKASSGGSYDLSKAADVAAILGLNTSTFNLLDKTTWPQTLQEVVDRNSNIKDASKLLIGSAGTGKSIEAEWLDFLSNWDGLADNTPLTSLSLAINQAPTGFASATLPQLVAPEAGAFVLTTAQLTKGFHDPDGDPLTVSGLTSDQGNWFSDNGDGSWSLDPASFDPSYLGPLELSYWVEDGQGHSLVANQLLQVVAEAPPALPPAPSFSLFADHGVSSSDGLTNDGTIIVAGVISGNSWEYSSDGGNSWTTGQGTSFSLGEGIYSAGSIQVQQRNAGGASPAASNAAKISIDRTAPTTPSLALMADTGASASDRVTLNPNFTVGALESGGSWEVSLNGGVSWLSGVGTMFSALDGSYGVGAIRLRQRDAAGNISPDFSSTVSYTIDTIAPAAPTFGLSSDTGSSTSDQISSNGLINVSGLESASSWQVSRDAGATWTSGSGSSFTLAAGVYGVGRVLVRQTDLAGNLGASTSNSAPITIDTAAPLISDQLVGGTSLVLRFAEPVAFPSASAAPFSVLNGKTKITVTAATVAPGGTSVTLSLATAITSATLLTVAYTDPSSSNDSTGAIEDLAGNDLASRSATTIRTFLASTSVNMGTGFNSGYTGVELTAAAGNASITGNSSANSLCGNTSDNTIKSGSGVDTITGGAGADTLVYTTLSDGIVGGSSSARTFERITDFCVGQDKFDVTNVPTTGAFKTLGSLTALTDSGLSALLTASNFVAKGAATFTYGSGSTQRSFLAFNDATAGFNATTDAVLEITGYSFASGYNTLSQISII